jgi:hypothetical protein
MAGGKLFEYVNMYKLEWRFDDLKIGKIDLYCAPSPLVHMRLSLGP